MEIKFLSYKAADIDGEKRTVKAYFSVFGNTDIEGDVVQRGAFTKSINEMGPRGRDMIRHFLNHDKKQLPLGRLIELGEDNYGAYFVSKLARTLLAEDIYKMYQDDMIPGHSMGFTPIPSKTFKTKEGGNIFTELKLFEVSTVTSWPANPDTRTIEVKEAEPSNGITSERSLSQGQPTLITDRRRAELQFINEVFKHLNR